MFVRLTVTKFEPFICMFGFALTYILNIHIIMILNTFCLFSAYFGYIIIKVRNLERQVYKARVGVGLGQLPVVRKPLFCSRCNLKKMAARRKFPGWTGVSHFGPNQCFAEG
jgi:hypothetical protein